MRHRLDSHRRKPGEDTDRPGQNRVEGFQDKPRRALGQREEGRDCGPKYPRPHESGYQGSRDSGGQDPRGVKRPERDEAQGARDYLGGQGRGQSLGR